MCFVVVNYSLVLVYNNNNNNSIITSASRTILLPSGHIIWSTWGLTRSHLNSAVRRLAWETKTLYFTQTSMYRPEHTWKTCINTHTDTHTHYSYQLYLCVWVSHVADYAAVLHSVQIFPPHHVFIAFRWNRDEEESSLNCISNKSIIVWLVRGQQIPVQVMTMSTCLTTSLSLITLKPSMLIGGEEETIFHDVVLQCAVERGSHTPHLCW